MMDGSSDFLSEKYQERPIILSPPPVAASVTMTFPQSGQTQNFQAQRNQSVGYNLQQEFEALKADLDLDLSYSNATEAGHDGLNGSSGPASRSETRSGETSDSLPAADVSLSSPGTGAPLHGPGSSTNSANSSGNGHVMSPPPSASTGNGSRVLSGGPSLLAPAANSPYSMAGHSHLNNHGHLNSHTPLSDALMRERSALSPSSSVGGTVGGPGLSSLLMNKNPGFASSLGSMPSRPQSVNDFSSILPRQQSGQAFSRLAQSGNFYSDMLATTNWIENLSPQDIMTMLDYWCNNLPFDILLTMKSRLHNHLTSGLQVPQPQPVFNKVENYPQYQSDFVSDMESLSFNDPPRSQGVSVGQSGLLQPKPKANNNFKSHLFADPKVQRPKSADPSMHNRIQHGSPQVHLAAGERARSPTSHLYEKTNFLQLAAGSHQPHAYGQGQQHSGNSEEGFDQSNAHKLGALATINSRVALDFNRKAFQQSGQNRGHSAAAYEESLNRQSNSSSVPTSTQKYSVAAMSGGALGQPKAKKEGDFSPKPKISSPSTPVSNNSSMPAEIVNQDLLNNIPAWLKLLRLHKYTDYLKDIYWEDLVELTDEDLEDKGVKALGARRKLLKAFEAVKLSKA